ncbi:hypothetical protein [Dokdonia sp.]|uniref:hypothetical protein n=1 Tax=Dokdonia sp. TaxID=2024995 RepID=UPI003264EE5B
MGWKSSLIIIENKEHFTDEEAVLKAIGKGGYTFDKELTLDACIYPNDGSINIGYYNSNMIISDDYQITTNALERATSLQLTKEEKGLTSLFPKAEIVSVACHSVVNYHGYSLIQNGAKKRLKIISSDTPLIEFGEKMEEEQEIYKTSYSRDGKNYWKDTYDPEEELTEDQLMEEFTFGIAKRRLGVSLDKEDGEELLFEKVLFKKYINTNQAVDVTTTKKHQRKVTWIKYGIIVLILIILQILKRVIFGS